MGKHMILRSQCASCIPWHQCHTISSTFKTTTAAAPATQYGSPGRHHVTASIAPSVQQEPNWCRRIEFGGLAKRQIFPSNYVFALDFAGNRTSGLTDCTDRQRYPAVLACACSLVCLEPCFEHSESLMSSPRTSYI